jgi:hypothetical protein
METTYSSETSVAFQQIIRHCIPEGRTLQFCIYLYSRFTCLRIPDLQADNYLSICSRIYNVGASYLDITCKLYNIHYYWDSIKSWLYMTIILSRETFLYMRQSGDLKTAAVSPDRSSTGRPVSCMRNLPLLARIQI